MNATTKFSGENKAVRIEFFVAGEPSRRMLQWKETLMWQAKVYRPKQPLRGDLALCLLIIQPSSCAGAKSDGGKLAKVVMNALAKMGYWQDASQIAVVKSLKQQGTYPGVRVAVETLGAPVCA